MTDTVMKLFPLEPPYRGRGGMFGIERLTPLAMGPLLARTRGMSRWHRVKSGVRYTETDLQVARTSWDVWCGQGGISHTDAIARDDLPTDGLPICGPCEGKALGAGYNGTAAILAGEALLLFEPRSKAKFRRPASCPGSGTGIFLPAPLPATPHVGVCGACGLLAVIGTKGQGRGYSYQAWDAIKPHQPGPDLIDPCPFHAWDELTIHDGTAVCRCTLIKAEASA